MTDVSRTPFNLIPEKWAFDPEIGPFIQELLDVIWQLRTKSGGDSPDIPTTAINQLMVAMQYPRDESAFIHYVPPSPPSPDCLPYVPPSLPASECLPYVPLMPVAPEQLPPINFVGQAHPFTYVTTTANYTTAGNMIVEAQAVLTVYLSASPRFQDTCIIKRNTAAGTVTISGNGNTIDGAANQFLSSNFHFRVLMFNGTQWVRLAY
jgi:hypothetical protein